MFISYRVHRSGVAQPCVVHFFNVGRVCAIEERLSRCWVVSFHARCSELKFEWVKNSPILKLEVWRLKNKNFHRFSSKTHLWFLLTHQPGTEVLLAHWGEEIKGVLGAMHFFDLICLLWRREKILLIFTFQGWKNAVTLEEKSWNCE